MKPSPKRALAELIMVIAIVIIAVFALHTTSSKSADYTLDNNTITYHGGTYKHQFSGYGTLKFTNHDYYSGNFKDGRFNGQGTFTSHSGWKFAGNFKNGVATGTGTLTTKTHQVYRGKFVNGTYQQASEKTH